MGSRTNQIGYTLVEILIATTLTLIMVGVVVKIFAEIGKSVSHSRATLEMSGRMRATRTRLEMDLAAVTATMLPPLRPENGEGYFEYIEGPVGPVIAPGAIAKNTDDNPDDPASAPEDSTVGDFDDILMFTIHSTSRPFVGSLRRGGTIESYVAEVAWFLRGRTLYRRVLLVVPGVDLSGIRQGGFFNDYDISVRWENDSLIANSLGDLTKRECRYAHRVHGEIGFPFDAAIWGQLGLPTLRECSSPAWFNWPSANDLPRVKPATQIDFWNDPHPWDNVDRITGTLVGYEGRRIAEDVILTNVIGFDVKAWDPRAPVLRGVNDNHTPLNLADDTVLPDVVVVPGDGGYALALAHLMEELEKPLASRNQDYLPLSYGAYADLDYSAYASLTHGVARYDSMFAGPGNPKSSLVRVYDTWSSHYEHDGINQDGDLHWAPNPTPPPDKELVPLIDEGINGFDDDGNGIVDDPSEMETCPPYPVPLRAIQVKIRVYEPDSRQIREVTVVQEFLPK